MRFVAPLVLALFASLAGAGDWPAYRADAARSGYSADSLPAKLDLRWVHRSQPPARLGRNPLGSPTISPRSRSSAARRWSSAAARTTAWSHWIWPADSCGGISFTGGPVRFAPAAWRDRVFVASDDGYLYALALDDGRLLWKHRGGPNARMCLGNGRMISRWPARGGPVVWDDTVYYAAGIWPSEGVYLHALDAATGTVRWTNDRAGSLSMPQPHGGANAASGVAAQGYLLATAERLFVPTGRAVPAAFRRSDGELEYYRLQDNGSIGGARAVLADRFVINGGCFLETATGNLAARGGRGVFSVMPDGILQFTGSSLASLPLGRRGNARSQRPAGALPRLSKYCEIQLGEESDEVRRAAQAVASLPGLKNLFQTRDPLQGRG